MLVPMARLVALLAFAAVVAGIFLLPAPSYGRLSAFQAGDVLDWTPREESEDPGPTLLDELLASPATVWTEPTEEGQPRIADVRIAGVRMTAKGDADPILHIEAKRSLIRKLRSVAAGADWELSPRKLDADAPGGANVLVEYDPDSQRLKASLAAPGAEPVTRSQIHRPPSRLSLLPPLLAILLAILLRKPVIALLMGVIGGAILRLHLQGEELGVAARDGLLDTGRRYFLEEARDNTRLEIVLFVVFMLAMVGVISRGGGLRGLMDRISVMASNARKSQIATWLMGLVVFFDDYANTILVGSTMRPLSDRFKIAREKLAFIVDSTAAPVAGISIFSTWIAFEVSTFSTSLPDAGLATTEGYAIFIQTLPYRYYCFLTLFFVGLIVLTGRDFGPMLTAERRARAGEVIRPGGKPLVSATATEIEPAPSVIPRASVALMPLLTFIGVTIGLILSNGGAFKAGADLGSVEGWTQVLYDGSGGRPLMFGALFGLLTALVASIGAGMSLWEGVKAAVVSLLSMLVAIVILYLAWMIGRVCTDLGTAKFLAVTLGDAVPAIALPVILFLLAAVVAFSTGSSWSTMTILLPLVVGLSYRLGETSDVGGVLLVVMSIGAVLEGAIFGDHCSPISDTTVMSSIASASDHIDHVRTQAPYALTTMGVAIVFGYFPATFFASDAGSWLPYACMGAGMVALILIVLLKGKRAEAPA